MLSVLKKLELNLSSALGANFILNTNRNKNISDLELFAAELNKNLNESISSNCFNAVEISMGAFDGPTNVKLGRE